MPGRDSQPRTLIGTTAGTMTRTVII
jgi:hypothetical protein